MEKVSDNNSKIKVSVCVVTYNQENYIRQCLQSIVDQKTDFKFDVIVSDDCSTDRTRSILLEFAEKYPDIIKPILHDKNIGAYKNFVFVHQQAIGEYIAHVDGDDYCLPGKLQTQSDFLDEKPDCNIVFHRMLIETEGEGVKYKNSSKHMELYDMTFRRADIIQLISVGAHSSKMYRKVVRDFCLPDFDVVDYFANVEQIGSGIACFVGQKPFGVYRQGIGIASSGVRTREILSDCFTYFCRKYPEYRLQTNTAALTYLLVDLKNGRQSWKIFFKVWISTFHPLSLFNLLISLKKISYLRVRD